MQRPVSQHHGSRFTWGFPAPGVPTIPKPQHQPPGARSYGKLELASPLAAPRLAKAKFDAKFHLVYCEKGLMFWIRLRICDVP